MIDRATPYHRPHSTQVSGYAVIDGGDDRYIGNLFLGGDVDLAFRPGSEGHRLATFGTQGYDGYPATFAAYLAEVSRTSGDHKRFHGVKQPAYIHHNAYATVRRRTRGRPTRVVVQEPVSLLGRRRGCTGVPGDRTCPSPSPLRWSGQSRVTTCRACAFADADFEEPDGSPVVLHTDMVGNRKEHGAACPAGPLATLSRGSARIRVW